MYDDTAPIAAKFTSTNIFIRTHVGTIPRFFLRRGKGEGGGGKGEAGKGEGEVGRYVQLTQVRYGE